MVDSDGIPYATLGYINGPGFRFKVIDSENVTRDEAIVEDLADLTNTNYKYEAGVKLGSETHGGEDVAVYARGELER